MAPAILATSLLLSPVLAEATYLQTTPGSTASTQTLSAAGVLGLDNSGATDVSPALTSLISGYFPAGGTLTLPTTNSGSYELQGWVHPTLPSPVAPEGFHWLADPGAVFTSGGTGVSFTGTLSGQTLTMTGITGAPQIGQLVSGVGVQSPTRIVAGSGTSWTVTSPFPYSSPVGPVAMTTSASGEVDFSALIPTSVGPLYSFDLEFYQTYPGSYFDGYVNLFMLARSASQGGGVTPIVALFGQGESLVNVFTSAAAWAANTVGLTRASGATAWSLEADCGGYNANASLAYCVDARAFGNYPAIFGFNFSANGTDNGFGTGLRIEAVKFNPIRQDLMASASATVATVLNNTLTVTGTLTGTIAAGMVVTGSCLNPGTSVFGGNGTVWQVYPTYGAGTVTCAMTFGYTGAIFDVWGPNLVAPYGAHMDLGDFTTAEYSGPGLLVGPGQWSTNTTRVELLGGLGSGGGSPGIGANAATITVAPGPFRGTPSGDLTIAGFNGGRVLIPSVLTLFNTTGSASSPSVQFQSSALNTTYDEEIQGSGGTSTVGQGILFLIAAAVEPSGDIVPKTDLAGALGYNTNRWTSVHAISYSAGSGNVVGVACSGSPTSSFASVGGIVTHC